MSASTVVDVVFLERDIREPFTYRVDPAEYDVHTWTGQPVVVPLGTTLTTGVIVDERETEDDPEEFKPIRGLISPLNRIPEELVQVGQWVSRYYLSSPQSVFTSVFPQRYLPQPVASWTLAKEVSPEEYDPLLGNLFEESDTFTMNKVRETTDESLTDVRERLNAWVDRGVLEPDVNFGSAEIRPRRRNYVRLVSEGEESLDDDLSRRQHELVEFLKENGPGFYQKDLPDPLARTRLLDRMEEKGHVDREKRIERRIPHPSERGDGTVEDLDLTDEQRTVRNEVDGSLDNEQFDVHLVHGVTGSGKTEVYFRLIDRVLDEGKTALVLVPEITLASFMVSRFRRRFGSELGLLHSGLSAGERYDEWKRILEGDARVVLGVQSAVFAPLRNLGLIVVDEEHDSSYKAGQSPRYHARDVAVVRGRKADVPVVLGSATPSLESYSNALRGRYRKHEMRERPLGGEVPTVKVIDLKKEDTLLTEPLVQSTRNALENGNRAIWFYNRRGVSNFLLCEECGEVEECRRCSVSMTLHNGPRRLQCHYCGYQKDVPEVCSSCGSESLEPVGSGTQTLAEKARSLFEGVNVLRMDQDTVTKKNSRFRKLRTFGKTQPALLVGTQMVTKGLDYEDIEFVGVVLADTGLQFPDFRSGERTFQQLVQVCGRAGRKKSGAGVHVQTYNPGHYAILNGKNADYEGFATHDLQKRKPLGYPPFSRLINIVARGKREEDVSRVLNSVRQTVPDREGIQWLGPSPCGVDYVNENYRWHLLIRGHFNQHWKENLREAVNEHSDHIRLIVDVDPVEMH